MRPQLLALLLPLSLLGCSSSTSAYHPNGVKRFEGRVGGSGGRQGAWSYWYASGLMRERGSYVDDRRTGVWTQWHSNGQRYCEGRRAYSPRTDGCERIDAWTFWYPDGGLQAQGSHDADGRRHGEWTFWNREGEEDGARSGTYGHGALER